ncbi:ABC transporter permease [Luethyella okanaganae]|uniref:ABC transporter permease n=1 Tax=Luethyella okanaganae TaxID=69372 RepID=A0ABW1VFB3_9MICO
MKTLIAKAPVLSSPVVLSFVALAGLVLIAQSRSSGFLSVPHVGVILGIAAVLGIAGAAQTVVVLAAGIDLSVGAIISAADVLTVQWTGGNDVPILVVLLIVFLGAAAGALNGLGISLLGINPMVMTLGMAAVVGGLALVVTNGQSGGSPHPLVSDAMTTRFLGLPGTVYVWIAVAAATVVLLRYTELGRNIYAFGSNAKAAEIAGLRRGTTLVRVYAISGGFAAIAGVVLAGYTGTGAYGIGEQYTLMSVAAVVIGGASILGGRGSYAGTIAGVITLVVLDDVLSAAAVPIAGRQIVQGIAILLILVLYGRERRLRTTS